MAIIIKAPFDTPVQEMNTLSQCLRWDLKTYLCEDAKLVQGTLWGHGRGTGKAGRGRGVGCRGGGGGMVALLDQVWEMVDATSKAIPVRMLYGVVMVMMVVVVGAGGVVSEALERHRAGARGKACMHARCLRLAWARARTLSVVTCTLEVERGVHSFGSRCVPDEFRGREGIS